MPGLIVAVRHSLFIVIVKGQKYLELIDATVALM